MWKRLLLAIVVVACSLEGGAAQGWPTKPIRVIVPFGAGSATDSIARIVLGEVEKQIGQPFTFEYRAGAGGTIGASAVANAAADGYTLLFTSSAHTITPLTYSDLSYDAVRSFAPIMPVANLPNVLVISPAKGIKTVHELVASARAKPGSVTFASVGVGAISYLMAERFRISANFEALNIPFKGTNEALTEILAGRVDFFFLPVTAALPLIQDGRLIALAMAGSSRVSELPNVPTTVEAGYQNSDYEFWCGLLAPAKTPSEIVQRLNAELVKALQHPDIRDRMSKLVAIPMMMTPAQFEAMMKNDIESNRGLIAASKAKR
jgi:tripartite-type tricarboxylate transporter receptor subunit TctC